MFNNNFKKTFTVLAMFMLLMLFTTTCVFASSHTLYDEENMLVPSNLAVEELESGLLGNLKELAPAYIEAEKETGVNAIFIASISALESGWGKSAMATYKNNLFGYGNLTFNTKKDSIMIVANALKTNYLSSNGKYYNGTTVKSVEKCYCPTPVGEWSSLVSIIMRDMEYRILDFKEKNEKIEIIEMKRHRYQVGVVKKDLQIALSAKTYSKLDYINIEKVFNNIYRGLRKVVK